MSIVGSLLPFQSQYSLFISIRRAETNFSILAAASLLTLNAAGDASWAVAGSWVGMGGDSALWTAASEWTVAHLAGDEVPLDTVAAGPDDDMVVTHGVDIVCRGTGGLRFVMVDSIVARLKGRKAELRT